MSTLPFDPATNSIFDERFRLAGWNVTPENNSPSTGRIIAVDRSSSHNPNGPATTYGAWYNIPSEQFVREYDTTLPFIRLAFIRLYWVMPDGSRIELDGNEVRYTFNNFTGNSSRVSVMLTRNTLPGFQRWGRSVDIRNVETGSRIATDKPKTAGFGDVLDTVSLLAVVAGLGLVAYLMKGTK
jgi:hypothetical protein